MNAKEELKEQIKNKFSKEVITLNNKDYISMDMFINAIKDSMVYEALLGVILKREEGIEVSNEEILMYIATDYDKTEIVYSNDKYKLELKQF